MNADYQQISDKKDRINMEKNIEKNKNFAGKFAYFDCFS